jgi:hypothetical protein
MRIAGTAVLIAIQLPLLGCGEDPPDAPQPTETLAPSRISVITAWDFLTCAPGRFTLADGSAVEIEARECGDPSSSPTPLLAGLDTDLTRGISEPGRVEDGSLLLIGEVDGQVAWYAVAIRRGGDCPYELGGHAYDRGEALHFSSGLWLNKANSFTIEPAWIENGVRYLPKGVGFCLNEDGEVLRAMIPTRH